MEHLSTNLSLNVAFVKYLSSPFDLLIFDMPLEPVGRSSAERVCFPGPCPAGDPV